MCVCICLVHLLLGIVNLPPDIINLWIITLNSTNFPITALYKIDVSIITLNSVRVWTSMLDSVNIFIIVIEKHCVYWEVRTELFKVLFSIISKVLKIIGFKIAFIWKRKLRLTIKCVCLYSVGSIHAAEGAEIKDWQEKNNLRMPTVALQNSDMEEKRPCTVWQTRRRNRSHFACVSCDTFIGFTWRTQLHRSFSEHTEPMKKLLTN